MGKDLIYVYGTGIFEEDYITFGVRKKDLLADYDDYERFIKHCEDCVRKEDRYTAYVKEMKEAGLTRCAILGNIEEDSKVKLEMHHGPIFNLFDICDIVTRACLKRGTITPLTEFDVADLVLEEHRLGNIMTVMLSKTAHKGGHPKSGRNIFVDIHATVGRIDRFIDRWEDGMQEEHIEMITRYIEECKRAGGETRDNDLFATADRLLRFK